MTGRYSTNWNSCSVACLPESERAALQQHQVGSQISHDQILAAAQIEAQFVNQPLCALQPNQNWQRNFWASVFGIPLLRNDLFFFGVCELIAFRQPMPLPITDRRRLQSFFCKLDFHAPGDLLRKLAAEGKEAEWLIDDDNAYLLVRLPSAVAYHVATGLWASFALPDPALDVLSSVGVRVKKKIMGWHYIEELVREFVIPRLEDLESNLPQTSFSDHSAEIAAELIRVISARLLPGEDDELLQQCSHVVAGLQQFRDDVGASGMLHRVFQSRGRVCSPKMAYRSTFIIQCLLLSSHLRDAGDLKQVVVQAVKLVLPESLAKIVLGALERQDGDRVRLPTATRISRARMTVDAAYMLHCRQQNHEACANGGMVRYVMVDASVQGHFDFELIRVTSMRTCDTGNMYLLAQEAYNMWEDVISEVGGCVFPDEENIANHIAETKEKEQQLHAQICAGLEVHLLPAVVLGSGHSSLFHKFHATVHAFWLETGSPLALQEYCKSIFAFTTDQGVEYNIRKVPPVPVKQLFPWVPSSVAEETEELSLAPPRELQLELEAEVDLTRSCGIAGLLHIMHNSTMDLGRSMTTFDSVVKKMAHLSKFLARKDPKDRLLQSCFSGPITQHLQKDIKAFQVKLNTSRWGSIAVCVSELLKLEAALRYAWDSEKYGSSRPGDPAAQHGSSVDLSIVHDAISDPDFWGNLHMLESLAKVIHGCLTWIEGCPCHWELWDMNEPRFPPDVQAVWRACPLRGCRAPEIAEGAFQRLLLDLSNKRASELLTTLPRELSPESRALLLQEFERARSHLVFMVSLRLDHWRKPPWCVFGCAHPSAHISKRFLRSCLELPADTPLVQRMREQVLQFLDDEAGVDALPLLANFLGRLYFCPVAERAVEGDHAQAHSCAGTVGFDGAS